MGLMGEVWLLEEFRQRGWRIVDEEHFFVVPPDSFWDSLKGKQFHVYHAQEILRMFINDEQESD